MSLWATNHLSAVSRVQVFFIRSTWLQYPPLHWFWAHTRVEHGKFVHELTRNVQQVMRTLVWTSAPQKKRLDSWYWHRCRWEVTNNPGSLAVVTQSISSWPSFFGAPWSACAPGMSNQQILKKLHQKFPPSPWVPPLSHADPFFGYADRAVSAFWGFNP